MKLKSFFGSRSGGYTNCLMIIFSVVAFHSGSFAQNADITISGAATANGSWSLSAGTYTFTPSANSANILIADIQNRLLGSGFTAGNVTITTSCASCTQLGSISSSSNIFVNNESVNQFTLTLVANQDINLQGSMVLDASNLNGTNNTARPGMNFTAQAGRDFIGTTVLTGGNRRGNNSNGGIGGAITITAGNSILFSDPAGSIRSNGANAGANTFNGGNAGSINLTSNGSNGGISIKASITSNGGNGLTTGVGGNAGNVIISNVNNVITSSGSNDGITNTIFFRGGTGGTAGSNRSLIKNGTGIVQLSGSNSYLGATVINAGTLSVSSIANGGTNSNIGASTNVANNLTLNGGTLQINSSTISINRGFLLNASSTSTIEIVDPASVIEFTGTIGSTGTSSSLIISGNGQFAFAAQNISLLHLTILSGATLKSTSGTINVNGTFSNNGSFLHNSGIIKMNGGVLSAQGIHGISQTIFNNLTISNNLGVNLLNSQTVDGILTFTSGILTINSFDLNMGLSSSIVGAGPSGYVKTSSTGQLKQTVSGSVLFPIGNSAYNPATLNNTGTSDIFGMLVMDNVTDDGTGVGTTSLAAAVKRTWHITEATSGGSNASLTLNWNGAGEEINSFSSGTAFMSHYTSGWNNIGGTVGVNAITATGITSFSPFAITSANSGLSVELSSFQTNCNSEGIVNVNWTTASEHNSSHFVLERSRDGVNWVSVAKINAAGFSNEIENYSYSDNVAGELNYYRLSQVDLDGTMKKYEPVTVNCGRGESKELVISPNPGEGNFTLQYFAGVEDEQVTVLIIDLNGHAVYENTLSMQRGMNSHAISATDLQSGFYMIQLNSSSGVIMTERYLKH